jgi:hypothetical protein
MCPGNAAPAAYRTIISPFPQKQLTQKKKADILKTAQIETGG